ncbi:hypothetical protein GCM10010432_54840 [Catellatospora methionotrophica]
MMEQLVRWINLHETSYGRQVMVQNHPNRNALIAETAFRRAAVEAPLFEENLDAEVKASEMLALLPRGQFGDLPLTRSERTETTLVQQNIQLYCGNLADPKFFYSVPGCGIVDAAFGDIKDEGHLAEIKAVTRPFRSTDIRQLLTYSAMLYASGRSVDRLSLYNPRRARLFTTTLNEVSFSVGGRSGSELMQDLIDSMVGMQVSV